MNYQLSDEELYRLAYAKRKNLKYNTGELDFTKFACRVIFKNLLDKPQKYLEYGVYWWALKAVLAKNGFHFGNEMDMEICDIYHHEKDDYVIVAAENFKDMYRATWFKGTREFDLTDERKYHLLDADMEGLLWATS